VSLTLPARWPRTIRGAERRAALLFISPWLVGFCVFMAYPVLYTGYLSLTDYDVINDPTFVGLDNYRELLADEKVRLALRNTAVYTVMSVPTQLVLSLALALLLQRAGRAAGFFRTAFVLPKMTPPVAVGVLVLMLLNGQNGLLNEFLSWFGINGPNWTTDPSWVKPGLVVMSLWTVGSSVIILLAALQGVPEELLDAARVDGAGWWSRLRHVVLPRPSTSSWSSTPSPPCSPSPRRTPPSSAPATRRTATTPRCSTPSTCSSRPSSSCTWATPPPWRCCSSPW
jgi:multiple sugar transport system permease protein